MPTVWRDSDAFNGVDARAGINALASSSVRNAFVVMSPPPPPPIFTP